ncbi:MAG: ABC transporter ATP-binding protein [Cryobacterium sp.]|nr:ABC transporter ATP-binding protein [Cryobacterium sp.]
MMNLDLEELSAWHGTGGDRSSVLDRVSIALASGALGAVLGPSGSGKTTLLRTIAGLHRDASGVIRLGGHRLDGLPPERRQVGLVPQDGALFPHLTVAENIDFGLPRTERRGRRTADMLALLGLTPFAKRLPHELSGGQAQRVAVARALAPAPRLVLLDEPFSALDATLRAEVADGVRAALDETRTTALLVTHDQGEALSVATQLVVLAEGRVRQTGIPSEVYAMPADLWTGRFIGDANVLDGESDGAVTLTPLGALPHDLGVPGPVSVLVRPEQLRLTATAHTSARVGASGLARLTRYFGHDGLTEIALDSGEVVLARLGPDAFPAPGARVAVTVDGAVRVFPRHHQSYPPER